MSRKKRPIPLDRQEVSRILSGQLPASIDAEKSLLSCMILSSSVMDDILDIIRQPQDFYLVAHQAIYSVLMDLWNRGRAFDLISLRATLEDKIEMLESVGGIDYLIELAEIETHPNHATTYARIVRDKAMARKLIESVGQIIHDVHTNDRPIEELVDQAEQRIFEIGREAARSEQATVGMNDLIAETYEMIQAAHEEGSIISGLKTGLQGLDECLCGLHDGEFIILAARPAMGKTALATSMALNMVLRHTESIPVGFLSMEMSRFELAKRLIASVSGINSQNIRRNMLGPDDFKELEYARDVLVKAPLFLDDTPNLSLMQARSRIRRMVREHGVRVVFLDYIQLMNAPGAENRQQEVSAISRGLKAIARELKIPMVCLSQFNRNPESRADNRPRTSDLRESGSLEQDADVVLMLHREEVFHPDPEWRRENPDKCGLAEIIIGKQRNGPNGIVYLHFNQAITRFTNRHDMIDYNNRNLASSSPNVAPEIDSADDDDLFD